MQKESINLVTILVVQTCWHRFHYGMDAYILETCVKNFQPARLRIDMLSSLICKEDEAAGGACAKIHLACCSLFTVGLCIVKFWKVEILAMIFKSIL